MGLVSFISVLLTIKVSLLSFSTLTLVTIADLRSKRTSAEKDVFFGNPATVILYSFLIIEILKNHPIIRISHDIIFYSRSLMARATNLGLYRLGSLSISLKKSKEFTL
jgi:hypothetical protein